MPSTFHSARSKILAVRVWIKLWMKMLVLWIPLTKFQSWNRAIIAIKSLFKLSTLATDRGQNGSQVL